MTALIDADALIYIIAWNYREAGSSDDVKKSCDTFLRDILLLTDCEQYVGVFSAPKCFRHRLYRYAAYKGNRPDPAEWLTKWKDIIKEHFKQKHKFIEIADLEADDVVVALSVLYTTTNFDHVICSPDKDLRQVPGKFFNFSQKQEEMSLTGAVTILNEQEAYENFVTQIISGDSTDGICGIPKMGPVKSKKLLDAALDPMQWYSIAIQVYVDYYGVYYGPIIYQETKDAVQMLQPKHRLWSEYHTPIMAIQPVKMISDAASKIFDITG